MEEKRMSDDVELYLASNELVKASDMPITNEEKPTPKTTEEKKDKKPKAVRMGEIPEFRGRNKKRFRMSDGTEQDVFYASDVHALDAKTGQFEEIEDTLTEDEDGKHLVCGRHSFVAKFSNDESTDEIFSIEQGAHKVTVLAKKSSKTKKKGRKPDVRKRDFDTQSESKIVSFSDIEEDSVYEYTVEPHGVKENILIKSPKEAYKYPFILKCENVKAVFDAEQMTVSFKDLLTEEEVFHIPTPFMKDNNGVVSKAVHYELSEKKNGDAVFTVIADSEWMNDKARVFPVVIDPAIQIPKVSFITAHYWNNISGMCDENMPPIIGAFNSTESDGTCCENCDYSNGGSAPAYSYHRVYMKMPLADVPQNARIKKATLLVPTSSSVVDPDYANYAKIGLFPVGTDVSNCGDYAPEICGELIDFDCLTSSCEPLTYTFDITSVLDSIHNGANSNNNFVLKLVDESYESVNNVTLNGLIGGEDAPHLMIEYESGYAVNTSRPSHTHSIGKFGQAAIDLKYGTLTFDSPDFTWAGNRMPVPVKHVFLFYKK